MKNIIINFGIFKTYLMNLNSEKLIKIKNK